MRYLAIVAVVVVALSACKKTDDDEDDGGGGNERGVKHLREPVQHLREVGKAAKHVFGESGKFPIGTSKTIPVVPADSPGGKGCCNGKSDGATVDNKCPVTQDWAADPVWKALDFKLGEPSNYRYTYESSDGKSFTATAEGDLDCDGESAILTLTGTLVDGKPKTKFTLPGANVY